VASPTPALWPSPTPALWPSPTPGGSGRLDLHRPEAIDASEAPFVRALEWGGVLENVDPLEDVETLEAFEGLDTLEELDLTDCEVKDELVSALPSVDPSLEELELLGWALPEEMPLTGWERPAALSPALEPDRAGRAS